nr:putative reverse transcriptase domain-containing protein [Tanacetum cinerariifolium]
QILKKALGKRLVMSTAYHPKMDGPKERTNKTLEDMLRAVRCAPFEALYGRKCRLLVLWAEIRESRLIGPELVQETTDKVILVKTGSKRLEIAKIAMLAIGANKVFGGCKAAGAFRRIKIIIKNPPSDHNEFALPAEAAPNNMNGWVEWDKDEEEEDLEMEEEDEDLKMEEGEEGMDVDADEEGDGPDWILPYEGADL